MCLFYIPQKRKSRKYCIYFFVLILYNWINFTVQNFMKNICFYFLFSLFIVGCSPSNRIDTRMTETCSSGKSAKDLLGYTINGTLKYPKLWTNDNFCDVATQIKEEPFNNAKNAMDAMCDNTLKKLSETGSDAETIVKSLEMSADQNAKSVLKIISICTNEEKKKNEISEISKEIHVKLYSVGSMRVDNQICPAFLIETETFVDNQKSIGYSLAGVGECNGMQTSNALTYHPEFNPHGPLPGEFFLNTLRYDGDIPNKWMYKGNVFKMFVR